MDKRSFLRYWHNVRQLTLKLLEEFPADSFDYRPVPEIMTVSQQFRHILELEIYVREGFLTDSWQEPEGLPGSIFEKEMLKDRLRTENERTTSLLSEVPDGRFIKRVETPYGVLSGELLLLMAVDEEIHHRGNLYTYLRCLGKTPPQMIQNYHEILKEEGDVPEAL